MVETWFDPDLAGEEDLAAILQALSLGETRTPVLAIELSGTVPRLVLAGHAIFALFGASAAVPLTERLLRGSDPGAKRLALLVQTLSAESAPRLERLRFFVGARNEVVTFLCRRVTLRDRSVFAAAALNLRPELASAPAGIAAPPALPEATAPATLAAPMRDAAALQTELRRRWPAARTLRFLWQTDADAVCTLITPPLADVVGPGTANLVGRNLLELAPQLDPSGCLAARLTGRDTWSGLALDWPLTTAAATVTVVTGAIPAFGAQGAFDGFRGFGVIRLDQVKEAAPLAWVLPDAQPAPANVLPFPGGTKALSRDDEAAFLAIGATLREHMPVAPAVAETPVAAPLFAAAEPDPATAAAPLALPAVDALPPPDAPAGPGNAASREAHVGRNGLTVLDKLGLGLLVSRNNVPIFANRYLLDTLGFADEDALHAAGGMTHLFGGQPGNVTGSESVGLRGQDGAIIPASARMQSIEWDGLPATLLTLRPEAMRPAEIAAVKPGPEPTPQGDVELRELRAILETATDGVAVLDGDCTVLSLNRSGEALFGCDRAAVIGKPFLALFAPHNQRLASDYLEGLKSDATRSLLNDGREFLVQTHQGGTIPVFMTLGRLGPFDGGDPPDEARFCALFRDLTPWKKAEHDLDAARREAERASAAKSDFLAKVSHEIRTPLNAIIGFAEIIMDERLGSIGNERYKEYLRDIHGSGTHVMSLVNDLLDLSKIEAGRMELQTVAIDANKVVTECVSLMQPQASRERVIMRLSLAAHLPRVRADERSLRQIVLNLLSNAVKFNEPGGQVIIATAMTEAGCLAIRIRDTGPGMSDTDIEHALEPFRQLSGARQASGGTGLGLPLTKALVEANQALFSIRSKLHQGTLVEVAFPPAQVLAD